MSLVFEQRHFGFIKYESTNFGIDWNGPFSLIGLCAVIKTNSLRSSRKGLAFVLFW